jgi:hypothetical protein
MRILAAEDDLDNARLLENILRKNEHTGEIVPDVAKPCSFSVMKNSMCF